MISRIKPNMNALPKLTNSISTNRLASCVDRIQKVNGALRSIRVPPLTGVMTIAKELPGNGHGLFLMMWTDLST